MTRRVASLTIASLLLLCACARHDQWDDLDYARIARERYDNDYSYQPPSVAGCSDDDLYNCSPKGK